MTMAKNQQTSACITSFVIKQCRKFSLLYNERTTILSQEDELQLVQYCLTCYKQKNQEDFEASPAETLDAAEKVQSYQLRQLENLFQRYTSSVELETSIPSASQVNRGSDKQEEMTDAQPLSCQDDDTRSVAEVVALTSGNSSVKEKDIETCSEADAMQDEVLTLLESHKKTSNHHSILDCHIKFMQELSNRDSELHLFLKSCKDMQVTTSNAGYVSSVQFKLLEILNQLNPNIKCDDKDKDDCTDQAKEVLLTEPSSSEGVSENLETPSRVKSPVIVKETSPRDACSPIQASTPKTPATPAQRRGMQKAFVHDLFRCYIHLLVNSRSQLALARVFNIPDRGLDHTAFTHVKREAPLAGLSMYQYLASFIMRIRLGGAGYAPSSDAPLKAYVKGLGSFLDFTQKLQTVVEEVADIRSACRRVVNIIKNHLIQCKSGRFPRRLVEPCAADIHTSLASIVEAEMIDGDSPQRALGAGGSLLGRRCLRVLQSHLDQMAVQTSSHADHRMLHDLSFSSQTPTRIPCLLTQFRSPCTLEPEEDSSCIKKPKDSLKSTKRDSCFVSSALYIEEDGVPDILLTQRTLSSIEVLPSKTIAHPRECHSQGGGKENSTLTALSTVTAQANSNTMNSDRQKQAGRKGRKRDVTVDQENIDIGTISPSVTAVGKGKKPAEKDTVSDLSGASTPKSSKRGHDQQIGKVKKPGKSCRKRLLPQVKGQAKITGFFRM